MSKKLSLDERIKDLDTQANVTSPPTPYRGSLDERVRQAFLAGEDLIAIKQFSIGDRRYMPGDVIESSKLHQDNARQLGQGRLIVPGDEYSRARKAADMRDIVENQLRPHLGRVNMIRRELQGAIGEIAELEARLKDGHDRIATLSSQLKAGEAELESILNGPDVTQLFTS